MQVTNAKVIGCQGLREITLDTQGVIQSIEPVESTKTRGERVLDLQGDWLSLGGIDLQINGALGLAFTDLEARDLDKLAQICSYLWQQGIDGFCPTIVTTSVQKIRRSLAVIAEFQRSDRKGVGAEIIGVHLEGPFLNYHRRGAHPAEYLLPLNLRELRHLLADYGELVKIITLAPELEQTSEVIDYLTSSGITVSLGHSSATAQQAKIAFQQGASMVTHAFNAMPSLHHREPGLLGEAIVNPRVYCGLIADGKHVCATMMKILLAASNYERGIFLVSDALAPLGLPDGVYPWDERQIEVKNGTARLADGTLAGTTLPLLVGVENLVKWDICTVEQAIAMATESPRQGISLPGMSKGIKANLLRWHWDEGRSQLRYSRLKLCQFENDC